MSETLGLLKCGKNTIITVVLFRDVHRVFFFKKKTMFFIDWINSLKTKSAAFDVYNFNLNTINVRFGGSSTLSDRDKKQYAQAVKTVYNNDHDTTI